MRCAYCTDDATGYDEDGEPTCGRPDDCMSVVRPLPTVIEVSSDEDEDEDASDD